jgi:ATP-dependent helicase HepA
MSSSFIWTARPCATVWMKRHLDGIWPQQYARAILPYSLLDEHLLMGKQQARKKQRGLLDLDPPPTFDLVIVDEAHHIRNTDTWAYRNVRYFCDNAEAVVLLTATPIQLGDNDLYTLLHLLRPDVLPSRREFDQMSEPNPHLNAAIDAARGAREGWTAAVRASIRPGRRHTLGPPCSFAADNRLQEAKDLLDAAARRPSSKTALRSSARWKPCTPSRRSSTAPGGGTSATSPRASRKPYRWTTPRNSTRCTTT